MAVVAMSNFVEAFVEQLDLPGVGFAELGQKRPVDQVIILAIVEALHLWLFGVVRPNPFWNCGEVITCICSVCQLFGVWVASTRSIIGPACPR
jgi:hypothetical protein